MTDVDHLGRTPEQAARERAEIAQHLERDGQRRLREQALWDEARLAADLAEDREADDAAYEAERLGEDPDAAREAVRSMYRESREQRVYDEFRHIVLRD